MLIAIKDEEAKLKERLDQSSMDLGNLRKDIEEKDKKIFHLGDNQKKQSKPEDVNEWDEIEWEVINSGNGGGRRPKSQIAHSAQELHKLENERMEMARQFQGHKATIQEQADIIKYLQR